MELITLFLSIKNFNWLLINAHAETEKMIAKIRPIV